MVTSLTGFVTDNTVSDFIDVDSVDANSLTMNLFNYSNDADNDNIYSLKVWLYGDDALWEAWSASIDDEEDDQRTENEKLY